MEMGIVSKRQQHDKKVENSQRSTIGLQHREKIRQPKSGFSWLLHYLQSLQNHLSRLYYDDDRMMGFLPVHRLIKCIIRAGTC